MPIKKLLLAFIFSMLLLVSKGQQIEIRPSVGMGTYAMSELKDLMRKSASESPFDLKTTEDFPPYAFYQLDIIHYTNSLGWGLTTGFYSTGARNHYADYSGFYREDLNVQAINLGLLISQKMPLGNQLEASFEFASGVKFTKMNYEGQIQVGDETDSQSQEAKVKGWWATPQLRIGRPVYKNITLSVFAGYEFMLVNNLDFGNSTYAGPDINWSGLRAGVSLGWK